MAKNDYILPLMKDSGLYYVDAQGRVWTRKKLGGPGAVYSDRWRRCEVESGSRGRLQVRHNGVLVYASRFVWYWHCGYINEQEIDHKNNDVKDNRIENLGLMTRQGNQRKAEQDGLIERRPSDNRSQAIKNWWRQPGIKERMSDAAKRGWEKRKQSLGPSGGNLKGGRAGPSEG